MGIAGGLNADNVAPYRVDGQPVYPQRPSFQESGLLSGATPSGELNGKMIVLQNAHDAATLPNAAHSWRKALHAKHGDHLDQQFRLWYTDHASHIPASMQAPTDPPTHAECPAFEERSPHDPYNPTVHRDRITTTTKNRVEGRRSREVRWPGR